MTAVTDAMLADLPSSVARSLRGSGVVGREIPTGVHLRQRGEILLRGRWFPFAANEQYRLDPPAFAWRGTVKAAGIPLAQAEDSLEGLRGRMHVRLLGLFTVVDEAGPEMDHASVMRWLNETMWFPQVWATDVISWSPIDETSAAGSVTVGDVTAQAEFRFDAEGRFVDFRGDRHRAADSGFELTSWATPIVDHARFDGIEVPASGRALWLLDGAELEYIRIRITEIRYDAEPG
jgi:hypothetical protein